MIPKCELRLGNLVNYTGFNAPPGGINWCAISELSGVGDEADVDPIPLTPEILEAAGFKQVANYQPEGPTCVKGNFTVWPDYQMLDYSQAGGKVRITRIKHLHQLQNLYFALTGQELTVQLKQLA